MIAHRLSPDQPLPSAGSWPARRPPSVARHEIVSDGRTVWVNSDDGMCIGRFSERGIDVHADARTQMAGGKQCLDCISGLPFEKAWERFKTGMLDYHGIAVSNKHKPRPPSPAIAAAHAAIEARARRTARAMIKGRAKSYAREPRQLNMIAEGLWALPPRHLATALARLERTQRPQRWVGFGGEVQAINLRGAMLYARYLRAKARQLARSVA